MQILNNNILSKLVNILFNYKHNIVISKIYSVVLLFLVLLRRLRVRFTSKVYLKNGQFFLADISNSQFHDCLMGGSYEEHLLLVLKKIGFNGNEYFCDIGSNWGFHSINVLETFDTSKVICIEPNFSIFKQLEDYISQIGANDRAILHNVGLGHGDFSASIGNGFLHSGLGETIEKTNLNLREKMKRYFTHSKDFQVKQGDGLLSDFSINVIKIDAEGYELKILSGMQELISRQKPIIFFEFNQMHHVSLDAFTGHFRNLDYRIYKFSNDIGFYRYQNVDSPLDLLVAVHNENEILKDNLFSLNKKFYET